MNNKINWGLLILSAMMVLLAACTSTEGNASAENINDKNAEKYANVFDETDVIAHDFMVMKVEQNYPEILTILSTAGKEELKERKSYLLDSHESPNGFEELNENYELRRYDNFYDHKSGEVYYRFRTPDEKSVLTNSWIVITQTENNEWKVKSYYGERPEMINDSNAETGTVLHELPED